MVVSAFSTAAAAVLAFLAFRVCVGELGYERYGLWVLLATVINFSQVGSLGMTAGISRGVADSIARGRADEVGQYLLTGISILLLSGSAIGGVVVFLSRSFASLLRLPDNLRGDFVNLVPWVAVLSVYVVVVELHCSALEGTGRLDQVRLWQLASQALGLAAAVALLRLNYGIFSLLFGALLACGVLHFGAWRCLTQAVPLRLLVGRNISARHGRDLLSFGGWVLAATAVNLLLLPFNRLMLARYGQVAHVTLLELAWGASMRIRSVFEASQRSLVPETSAIIARVDDSPKLRVRMLNRKSIQVVLLASSPIFIVAFLFAPLLLRFWLGNSFHPQLPGVFRFLLVATAISLVGVPGYYALLGAGRTRGLFLCNAAQGLANALAVCGFVLWHGSLSPVWVAVAMLAGMSASTAVTLFAVFRR